MTGFHERITELYKEAQALDYTIGRKAFAELLGVTRSQMNGWLDGTGRPDMHLLKSVAKNSGVETSWLIGESEWRNFPLRKFTGLPPEAENDYQKLLTYLYQRHGVTQRKT